MGFAALALIFTSLFVGSVYTRVLSFSLPRLIKILIAPSLGQIVLTLTILVISLILGFTNFTIWMSIILNLALSLFFFFKHKNAHTHLRFDIGNWIFDIFKSWPLLIAFVTIVPFAIFIFSTKVLAPAPYGLTTGGGGLWADTGMHAAFTMSLVTQGLPPQNPLFAGRPLIYPFLVNLYSGALIKLGATLQMAFVIPQIFFFIGFVTLLYAVGKKLVGNRATFLALLIFFLGWGLGFIPYIQKSLAAGDWQITEEYTHDYKMFHLHNPLTGLIFPERSLLPGLCIGLLIVLLLLEKPGKRNAAIAGVLYGTLLLWHTHTFIFFALLLTIWYGIPLIQKIITSPGREIFKNESIIHPTITLTSALIFALPTVMWFASNLDHSSFIRLSGSWVPTTDSFLFFWIRNSGAVIPLSLAALMLNIPYKRIFVSAVVMFGIANFVIFQPWDWDNIKLFTWIFLFFALLCGKMLVWLSNRHFLLKPFALLLLLSLCASGTLSLLDFTPQTYTLYDNEDMELATWIKQNTKPTDVFAINPTPNQPIAALTGRSVYLGYPGQLWVHGIDYGDRDNHVQLLLSNTAGKIKTEVPISYIVFDQNKIHKPAGSPVFRNEKYLVVRYD